MIVNGAGSASFFVSNVRRTVSHQQLLNSILLSVSLTAPPDKPVKVQIDVPCTGRRIHATVRQLSRSVQNQRLHYPRLAQRRIVHINHSHLLSPPRSSVVRLHHNRLDQNPPSAASGRRSHASSPALPLVLSLHTGSLPP